MPKIIQVIESVIVRGSGMDENPYRQVIQYHTLEGKLLAEFDTMDDSPSSFERPRWEKKA